MLLYAYVHPLKPLLSHFKPTEGISLLWTARNLYTGMLHKIFCDKYTKYRMTI